MKPTVVVVLDVGKTNKKARAYDRAFQVLAEERTTVEPVDYDGLEVENTERLVGWFREALKKLSAQYDIRTIAITAHGATVALLDEAGALACPVVSYTAEKGAEVQDEFYDVFGDRASLHRATATPDVGFANIAKVLYYIKSRLPEAWAHARHALFLNAYLGYELTGEMGIEPTYLGNHSYLWDFAAGDWSTVGRALKADQLFPSSLSSPWDALGTLKPELAEECGLSPECRVTLGIHDSNANFLPYLAQGYENFLLNSTGTWCVLMRQAADASLTDEEVAAKVLFNLDVFNRPVRTCIFPAGMEYDAFRGFTELSDESDFDLVRSVIEAKDLFVIPGVLPDATAFPGATPRVVTPDGVRLLSDLKAAGDAPLTSLGPRYFAALNLSLALATRKMLGWCGVEKGTTVFIEGGFANNRPYCELLATLCPEQTFALTSVKEGTSFGAALTAWMLAEGLSLEQIGSEFTIETTDIPRRDAGEIAAYEEAFSALLQE